MLTLGIVGHGFVGGATKLFGCNEVQILIYDLDPSKCEPRGLQLSSLMVCDFIFVCVPTPMNPDGSCHTGIVQKVVSQIKKECPQVPIIVRSTVPVGTCQRLGVAFMPEFLRERNFEDDFRNCRTWIFGLDEPQADLKTKLDELIERAHQYGQINYLNIEFTDTKTAELVKYARNSFLATKIAFCNEIYRFSESQQIPFDRLIHLVALDSRIGPSCTQIPGPDGKFGYGGTCLPKDTNALWVQLEQAQVRADVLEAVVRRNVEVDRPEQDWELNVGRSVVQTDKLNPKN